MMYSRRISWIASDPEDFSCLNMNVSVVEYTGKFPGRGVHGNVKNPPTDSRKSKLDLP